MQNHWVLIGSSTKTSLFSLSLPLNILLLLLDESNISKETLDIDRNIYMNLLDILGTIIKKTDLDKLLNSNLPDLEDLEKINTFLKIISENISNSNLISLITRQKEKLNKEATEIIKVLIYPRRKRFNNKLTVILDDLNKIFPISSPIEIIKDFDTIKIDFNLITILSNIPEITTTSFEKQIQSFTIPLINSFNKDKTENEQKINLLTEIIRKRIPPTIIPDKLTKELAIHSGGSMKFLIELLKQCILEIRENGLQFVDTSILKKVIQKESQDFYYLNHSNYNLLKNVHDSNPVEIGKDMEDFLKNNIILKYVDESGSWYDVHPIVMEVINNNNK